MKQPNICMYEILQSIYKKINVILREREILDDKYTMIYLL